MTSKYRRSIWHQHQPHVTDLLEDMRTSESPWSLNGLALTAIGIAAGIACLFALAMLTNVIDQRAEVEQLQLMQLTKTERTSQALPTNLVQAYERGLADAMESINGTPQGVALAQACLAAGVGGRP